MSHWFEKLAERQMLEAALVDAGEAVGYRIMAEHGALPEEIRLRKERDAAKAAYACAPAAEKKPAMAQLAEAEMKLSIASEARKRFMR